MPKKYITDDLDVNGRVVHNGITENNPGIKKSLNN